MPRAGGLPRLCLPSRPLFLSYPLFAPNTPDSLRIEPLRYCPSADFPRSLADRYWIWALLGHPHMAICDFAVSTSVGAENGLSAHETGYSAGTPDVGQQHRGLRQLSLQVCQRTRRRHATHRLLAAQTEPDAVHYGRLGAIRRAVGGTGQAH